MHGAEQSTLLKSDTLGRVSTSKQQREVLLDATQPLKANLSAAGLKALNSPALPG
jgi:hypothetical protein